MDRNSDNCKNDAVQSNKMSSSSEEIQICSPSKPDSGSCSESEVRPSNPIQSSMKNFMRSSLLDRYPSVNQSSSSTNSESSSKAFVLNPPRLSNPFTKSTEEDKDVESSSSVSNKEKSEDKTSSPTKNSLESTGSSVGKVSFVPLGRCGSSGIGSSSSASVSTSTTRVSSAASAPTFGSFVFGQNLRDKVDAPKTSESTESEVSSTTDSQNHLNNIEEPKANGTTSEMLFSSAVKTESGEGKSTEAGKSLSEAAREYEEARSVKRKFEPVQLITGEEHEHNVLQMNCKLFAYDKVSAGWQERGRGLLRLNDLLPSGSRLIIRAHGSLRVLINTQVWAGMTVQRASPKSLRITAMDNGGSVKVFLVSASQAEIDQLQRYLESRVKKLEKCSTDCSTSKKLRTDETSGS